MAAIPEDLRPFVIRSMEGLEEGKEKGRGSYGAVYEVCVNSVPCIAKRLHDILVGRGREEPVEEEAEMLVIDRFIQECILLSGLRHPNVVQFMGVHFGRDKADISLIMEYMHMDLEQCMKTYLDIPLSYKISILRDVAYGLAYLHSIPIIHRDLNAGNVLLTESLRAKIADLGMSKLFDREVVMQHTRTKCPGALDFMPPESLIESPKYDVQLDVFSFGHLILYLVGQKPPHVMDLSVTPGDVQRKQMQVGKRRGALDQMGSQHPLYSTAVECLSDTPMKRPSSAELVVRLEEILKNFPLPHRDSLEILATLRSSINEYETALKEKDQQLAEKDSAITELFDKLDQESAHFTALEKQHLKMINDYDECNREMNATLLKNETLKQQIEILQTTLTSVEDEARSYKENFEQERRNRERIKRQVTQLQDELVLMKEHHAWGQTRKQAAAIIPGMPTHTVAQEYEKVSNLVFYELPPLMQGYPSGTVRRLTGAIFQRAYDDCKQYILEKFSQHLTTIVEMDSEKKSLEYRKTEGEPFADLQGAYGFLLSACKLKETLPPKHMANTFDLQTLAEEIQLSTTNTPLLNNVVAEAISVAWKMLTLVPPPILCTPEKFSEDCHEVVGEPCVKGGYYKLSYYRPLMLYHAHGPVAVKAIVKKETSSEPTVNTESDSDEEESACEEDPDNGSQGDCKVN